MDASQATGGQSYGERRPPFTTQLELSSVAHPHPSPQIETLTYDVIKTGMLLRLNGGPVAGVVKDIILRGASFPGTTSETLDTHRFPFIVVEKDDAKRVFTSVPFVPRETFKRLTTSLDPSEGSDATTDGMDQEPLPGEAAGKGWKARLGARVEERYLKCFVPEECIRYEDGLERSDGLKLRADSEGGFGTRCGWAFVPMAISSDDRAPDGLVLTYEWEENIKFSDETAKGLYKECANEDFDELRIEFIGKMQTMH